MSAVRKPLSRVTVTAVSILVAAFASPRPYRRSIATLSTVANGFALSCVLGQSIQDKKMFSHKAKISNSFYLHAEVKIEATTTLTCPAISGAEPCIGLKIPGP